MSGSFSRFSLSLVCAFTILDARSADTDGDGLSDLEETVKYHTDPEKADSDGDGTPDGDWNERREFSYSIRFVTRVLNPVNRDALRSLHQDARILQKKRDWVEIEFVSYPFARLREKDLGGADENAELARQFVAPTRTANWDAGMRTSMLGSLGRENIHLGAMRPWERPGTLARWLLGRARHHTMFGTYFYDFSRSKVRVLPGLETAFAREKGNTDIPFEEHLQRELFGKGMYETRSYGTCTSAAVYLAAGLRAMRIPTRMVLAIPCIDGNDPEQLAMAEKGIRHARLKKAILAETPRSGFSAHTFNEVLLHDQWIWLNYSAFPAAPTSTFGLMLQVNAFADLADAGLTETWGHRYGKGQRDAIFKTSNPYRTYAISDLVGRHAKLPDAFLTSEHVPVGDVTFESAQWWQRSPLKGNQPNWRDDSKDAHLIVRVTWESGESLKAADLVAFLADKPTDFTVGTHGNSWGARLNRGSVWMGGDGRSAHLEIVVPRKAAEAARDKASLVAPPPKDGFEWVIPDAFRLPAWNAPQ